MKPYAKTISILALGVTFAFPTSSLAQTIIDGSNIDDIVNIAKGYGSATLQRDDEGEPAIRGRIKGNAYYLTFRNCSGENSCEDFYFQAFVIKPVLDLDKLNEWNFNKRWTKLYFDDEDDAVLEMDVNLGGGVTLSNLEQSFSIWSSHMEIFLDGFLEKK